jgi:hypothetical protein
MKRLLWIPIIIALTSCELTKEENCALTVICTDICIKNGISNSFSFGSTANGFGYVFNYVCFCYPKVGFGAPLEIIIPKKKAKDVEQTVCINATVLK